MNTAIDVYYDGGSRNNQDPEKRHGHGSFLCMNDGKIVTMTIDRGTKDEVKTNHAYLDFPGATSPEAEWKTFLTALAYAAQLQNAFPTTLQFTFHGDSENVLNTYIKGNKVRAKNLQPIKEQADAFISLLDVKFVKETGDRIKEVLGH